MGHAQSSVKGYKEHRAYSSKDTSAREHQDVNDYDLRVFPNPKHTKLATDQSSYPTRPLGQQDKNSSSTRTPNLPRPRSSPNVAATGTGIQRKSTRPKSTAPSPPGLLHTTGNPIMSSSETMKELRP
jgi:hypothetical protein